MSGMEEEQFGAPVTEEDLWHDNAGAFEDALAHWEEFEAGSPEELDELITSESAMVGMKVSVMIEGNMYDGFISDVRSDGVTKAFEPEGFKGQEIVYEKANVVIVDFENENARGHYTASNFPFMLRRS